MNKNDNRFGSKLEKILVAAGIKNYTAAKSLKYDVSYISKWISGKAVPSKKNIDEIISTLCQLITDRGSDSACDKLMKEYGCETEEDLYAALKKDLLQAYYETIGEFNDSKYVNNASVVIRPEGQYPLLHDYVRDMATEQPLDIAVLADLFSLDRMTKLLLAGIEDNRFKVKGVRSDIHLHMILNIDNLKGSSVYDVILLVHMLTNYSLLDFTLSESREAEGKLLFSVLKHYAGVSFLSDKQQYICTVSSSDEQVVRNLYDSIINSENTERTLFSSLTLQSMLESHEYIQLLLSKNKKWLVGHMMELFITEELFCELLQQEFEDDEIVRKEAERAYLLAGNVFCLEQQTSIMMYDSALTNFMLSGELDFFNRKVILSVQQRKRQLEHLKSFIEDNENLQVKMVVGGFSNDFRYITNPCVFLSDSIEYLRLENNYYDKNILLVRNNKLKEVFNDFYDEIWNSRQDVVISERKAMIAQMDNLIRAAELLCDIE